MTNYSNFHGDVKMEKCHLNLVEQEEMQKLSQVTKPDEVDNSKSYYLIHVSLYLLVGFALGVVITILVVLF